MEVKTWFQSLHIQMQLVPLQIGYPDEWIDYAALLLDAEVGWEGGGGAPGARGALVFRGGWPPG
jgi:hypothetical protein